MASLVVVLIILGCAAYQYFKGTFAKSFATIIVVICAGTVAFSYFEALANVIISRSDSSSLLTIAPWAQSLCFVLLFVLAFAILQTAAAQLMRRPVDLGFLPERIGRVACGIISGLIASGLLLTAFQMGPLPIKYPYQRFDPTRLEPENPDRILLNADGFAAGLFSIMSNGSFSGKRSFATLHPDYLDQLFLNRLIKVGDTSIISSTSPAIEVPKPAVWPASETLKEQVDNFISELNSRGRLVDESTDRPVPAPGWLKGSYDPTVVRVGIKRSGLKANKKINAASFTHSQLRLICKRKGYGEDKLTGKGRNIYPIGHLKAADQIRVNPEIEMGRDDFEDASKKFIDFVFCVPSGFEPVLVEFKLNNVAEIPSGAIVSADQAPPAAVLKPSSEGTEQMQRPQEPPSQPEEPETTPRGDRLSNLSESITGLPLDEDQ